MSGIIVFSIWLLFSFLLARYAKNNGRSYGAFFFIGFFFSPLLGLFVLLAIGPKENENTTIIKEGEKEKKSFVFVAVGSVKNTKEYIEEHRNNRYLESNVERRKCPFCAEDIKTEAIICRYCGKNVQEYDLEKEKEKKEIENRRLQAIKDKYSNISDIFNDETIMDEAKELRRIYGKSVYLSYLKNKAHELGLEEIELKEDEIE